jgi:hypothetical protein
MTAAEPTPSAPVTGPGLHFLFATVVAGSLAVIADDWHVCWHQLPELRK